MNKHLVTAAILGASALATTAHAVPDAPKAWEKCVGIAKAGHNDCGALDGSHSCSGLSKTTRSDQEWVYVPVGTCEKIDGGHVIKVKPAK
ncbi:MAG: DUF2282 domain-containing protein [Oceanobacter sp.]|jgi:uncharacterized membrane protein